MPAIPSRAARLALAAVACATAAGCGSFNISDPTRRLADAITPYRIEVVQGNFVSKEQVDALKAGMSRAQVRDILGSPLLASVFHGDRWDYVFTLVRPGVDKQARRLTVYFKGDAFERAEGDPMPSEAEFVATLDNKRQGIKPPSLEATEEALQRFEASRGTAARPTTPPEPAAPATTAYPPLEPAAR